jgi:hypothetical protein
MCNIIATIFHRPICFHKQSKPNQTMSNMSPLSIVVLAIIAYAYYPIADGFPFAGKSVCLGNINDKNYVFYNEPQNWVYSGPRLATDNNQVWKVEHMGGDYFKLLNLCNKRYLCYREHIIDWVVFKKINLYAATCAPGEDGFKHKWEIKAAPGVEEGWYNIASNTRQHIHTNGREGWAYMDPSQRRWWVTECTTE